ncbi:hypothetical protein EMIHUDRAFT_206274 [Emiliania huxleyi CCMP1516]|uniref:AP2/ERF domain-containing protein n=2 Tax=Emiliania huxleyi TaxID=2903 RepID=A0A0D3JNR0_EMIH1|nr:hypothetical protein EMIHUDRAFT_206274 [Emiliania huxleyi CCMP1516]EOD25145.1 hypothetical protein EMIHUDRAFT_206274 [Emiliania huxleyi CCMP1516]|eukprot:XP_005777574.1 hypothetical protein EMIHUDRAFT_206274 [Emiliania huxleyi CCMP1516]
MSVPGGTLECWICDKPADRACPWCLPSAETVICHECFDKLVTERARVHPGMEGCSAGEGGPPGLLSRAAVWPPQPSGAGLDAVRLAGAEGAALILSFYTETGYKGVIRGEYVDGTPFYEVRGCSISGRKYISPEHAALARWRAIFPSHLQLPEAGRSSRPRGGDRRAGSSRQAAAVAAEAEGLRLHLSSSSSTGYKGVSRERSRFRAQHHVDGKDVYLGSFDTAVEAAVAYARAVGEYQPPAQPPPTVAAEAEGLRLHLSTSSRTGYKNVSRERSRFRAQHHVDGKDVYLGSFDTAVEAAVAYARAVGEAGVAKT